MTMQRMIDDLLMRGCDDWVDAAEVVSVAIELGGMRSEKVIRELSLELVRFVVLHDMMELGELGNDGFQKWTQNPQVCLDRVEREWIALGRHPEISEICWLRNTEKGNELGEALFKKRDGTS